MDFIIFEVVACKVFLSRRREEEVLKKKEEESFEKQNRNGSQGCRLCLKMRPTDAFLFFSIPCPMLRACKVHWCKCATWSTTWGPSIQSVDSHFHAYNMNPRPKSVTYGLWIPALGFFSWSLTRLYYYNPWPMFANSNSRIVF